MPALSARRLSEETHHGQRVFGGSPASGCPLTARRWPARSGADAPAGNRNRRVEHLRAGAGQRQQRGAVPQADRLPMQPCRGGAHRRGTLDVSTVIDTNGAYDSVRIELHRVGAGFRPGPSALDLLDLSRPTQSFVKPAESMGGAARRVHSAEELADAHRGAFIESRTRTSLMRWCAHDRACHQWAVHRPVQGHPRSRAWGPAPKGRGVPPPGSGEHAHPRAGAGISSRVRGRGRPDPARTPAGRYRLAVPTRGRPAMCSSGCGHPGQTRPSLAAAATTRPRHPATVVAAFEPPHRVTARPVRTAPAVRPGAGGTKPPGVICCRVVNKPTNGDGRTYSAARTRLAAPPPR